MTIGIGDAGSAGDPLVAGFSDVVVAQIVRRACSAGFERWWSRVANAGYCARPVQLTGVDVFGREHHVLGRCKNRPASVCPSCSDLYAADTWQLIHAGIAGGHHDIPATVSAHPSVFVTLTAPGFGAVHSVHTNASGGARRCRRERGFRPDAGGTVAGVRRCCHGKSLWCTDIHASADAVVGEPLCRQCYDYTAQVLFTWHAPELWRRFTIAVRRGVAKALRMRGEDPIGVRVSFVKVVEMQRRVVPHFHAVIRLDDADADGAVAIPETSLDAAQLAILVRQAAALVRMEIPGPAPGNSLVVLRFGSQIDALPLTAAESGSIAGAESGAVAGAGVVSSTAAGVGRRVAGYLAKYVTKSVAEFGLTPHRLSPEAIDTLDVSEHVRTILSTITVLAQQRGYAPMLRWLHTLGYRGYVTTKSRRFSITMGALRDRRARWRADHTQHLGPDNDPVCGGAEVRVADASALSGWEFRRVGHVCDGDRLLAISAAVRAREHRWVAREEHAAQVAAERYSIAA
jgi:hypothetical protein